MAHISKVNSPTNLMSAGVYMYITLLYRFYEMTNFSI